MVVGNPSPYYSFVEHLDLWDNASKAPTNDPISSPSRSKINDIFAIFFCKISFNFFLSWKIAVSKNHYVILADPVYLVGNLKRSRGFQKVLTVPDSPEGPK